VLQYLIVQLIKQYKVFYSGKQKRHTVKNILLTGVSCYVYFLSDTCEHSSGRDISDTSAMVKGFVKDTVYTNNVFGINNTSTNKGLEKGVLMMAKNMKKAKVGIKTIMEMTGLSIEQIDSL